MCAVKLILCGDAGVGKTCLLSRWSKGTFRAGEWSTIGAAFTKKTFMFSGAPYELHIWDMAGQDRYELVVPIYSKGADGALLVFDLTRDETFSNLRKWCSYLNNYSPDIPVVIAGNKSDLTEQRKVTFEEGLEYARGVNGEYFETSAQNGSGVEDAFSTLAQSAITAMTGRPDVISSPVAIDEQDRPSRPCC
jgi:small GTP-binding protein